MTHTSRRDFVLFGLIGTLATGCGGDSGRYLGQTAGSVGTGGAATLGGNSATAGASTGGGTSSAGGVQSGGNTSVAGGGVATGGVVSAGGNGGIESTGGTLTTGGVVNGTGTQGTGGALASGGSTSGAANSGGRLATGGAATNGGSTATGGSVTTGTTGIGGSPTGGKQSTGGTPTVGGSSPGGATSTAPASGGTTSTVGVCGNGTLEAGESCDEGPRNGLFYGDGSGCSRTCTHEPICRNNGVTGPCSTTCGDGNVDPGEACDDGNQLNNDGCSATCTVETGFSCVSQLLKDSRPCPSNPALDCMVLPVTYRDFDAQNATGGHPDFFYLGAPATGGRTTGVVPGASTTTCVPDASGTKTPYSAGQACPSGDKAGPCTGLVASALGADGKPVYARGTCACVFTDWDNTGLLGTCPASGAMCTPGASMPSVSDCYVSTVGTHHLHVDTTVTVIQSADSFKQWYTDSSFSTKVLGNLELAATGTGSYQFSSSRPGAVAGAAGRTVNDDLHDICLASPHTGPLDSGFFPLEDQSRQKVCNIWPYWKTGLATNCCAGAACPVIAQWDALASYDNCPTSGTGGFVPKSDGTGGQVNGLFRNFYFTSEIRLLFHYTGAAGSIQFNGDDDMWIFVNGQRVLDLGGSHVPMSGLVTLDAGLTPGNTYEVAIFHADVHPRESNFELALSGFYTNRSVCTPR